MNDLGVLGKRLQLAGHTVIKTHAQRQQQVAIADRLVGVDAAVHAQHVQAQRIVAGKGPSPITSW